MRILYYMLLLGLLHFPGATIAQWVFVDQMGLSNDVVTPLHYVLAPIIIAVPLFWPVVKSSGLYYRLLLIGARGDTVTVVLMIGNTGRRVEAVLPRQRPCHLYVDSLCRVLRLPTHYERIRRRWTYSLCLKTSLERLETRSLADAGVRDGDTLILFGAVHIIEFGRSPAVSGSKLATPAVSALAPRRGFVAARRSRSARIGRVRPHPRPGVFDLEGYHARDPVDCTVLAPPEAMPDDTVLVEVRIDTVRETAATVATAAGSEDRADYRSFDALETEVRPGTELRVDLIMEEACVRTGPQTVVWRQRPASVQFEVQIPVGAGPGTLAGTVTFAQDSVPIGEIRFRVCVVEGTVLNDRVPRLCGRARRYELAFVSYALEDRAEILRRVQILRLAGIRTFKDLLDRKSSDELGPRLYRRINQSDVMFLFWSSAARKSTWVAREWAYALESRPTEGYIKPIMIEDPPHVPLPRELAHLNFNPGASASSKLVTQLRNGR